MKRNEIESKILKWKPWMHIVLGLFTYLIWFVVLLIIYIDYNNSNKNSIKTINNINNTTVKHTVKAVYFKVAGITYEDRQENIEKMLKKSFKLGYYEKYDGMTNAEIKDCGDTIYEANNIYFNHLKLIPTKYEGKDAIEIHVYDLSDENKLIMVGYVPKKDINEVSDFLKYKEEHPEYKYKEIVNLTGGKGKRVNFDDEMETVELNYGIDIALELYEQ